MHKVPFNWTPKSQDISGSLNQKGFILLLVPFILVALFVFGAQMLNRSKTAMKVSGSDLEYLQSQLCVNQCSSLGFNAATHALEKNTTITSGTSTCTCKVGKDLPLQTCETTVGVPVFKEDLGCYAVAYKTTELDVTAKCKDENGRASTLEETADLNEIPVFQFGVFFENFLEFQPGSKMTVSGRVHSNDTILFVQANGIYFDDWVTTPKVIVEGPFATGTLGDLYFGMKSGSGPDKKNVHNTSSFLELKSAISGWTAWKGLHKVAYGTEGNDCVPPVNLGLSLGTDSNHALIEWRNSATDDSKLKERKYAWLADLIYKNGWKDNSLATVTLTNNPLVMPTAPVFFPSKLPNRMTYWDHQAGHMLDLIVIDVNKLQDDARPNDKVIYLFDSLPSPDPAVPDTGGFFLYNGQTLKRPLTIVSNSRIVVMGDYNTTMDYTLPNGSKWVFPAAIICDYMTQMSPHFIPSEHTFASHSIGSPISSRKSGYTITLNSCVMAGLTNTKGTLRGQGGYNNLVHMIEDWGGCTYNKNGSMVQMWSSTVLKKKYSSSWSPPSRNFNFDSMYTDMRNMPPATPRVVNPNLTNWYRTRK